MREFVIRPQELDDFKWEYRSSDSWSKAGSFWIKAWVSSVNDANVVLLIVADEKPDVILLPDNTLPKRDPQPDELEQWSRKDTLWGDMKRTAIIAARNLEHAAKHLKPQPKVNFVVEFIKREVNEEVAPGDCYWFRMHPRKSSILNVVRCALVDKVEPGTRPCPAETWADFKQERLKHRLIVGGLVAAAFIGLVYFPKGKSKMSARDPAQAIDLLHADGENVIKYPSGEVHQKILWSNNRIQKNSFFYKNGKQASEIVFDEQGRQAKLTVWTPDGKRFENGKVKDEEFFAALQILKEYFVRENVKVTGLNQQ